MTKKTVSIVIPLYNPPEHWENNCIEHILAVTRLLPHYVFHFTFVDDGSTYSPFINMTSLLGAHDIHISTIPLQNHAGKGKALKKGVGAKQADYYICVDWDFPFGVPIFQQLLAILERGANVGIIDRGNDYLKQLPLIRVLLTSLWRTYIRHIMKLNVADTQGGLKVFDNEGKKWFLEAKTDSFFHDFEFISLCSAHNVRIETIVSNVRPGLRFVDFPLTTYICEFRNLITILRSHKTNRSG